MRYTKILVALDRSSQAEAVFEQALELAKKEEASLMLFHCLPFESQGVGWYADVFVGRELINYSREMQAMFRKESEESREWIARYCQKATEQGVPTEWDLKVGDAGNAIRELADTWGADLVVLGRRGRRGLAEIFMGSVSNYVVHYARCSVLIVQGITQTEDMIPVATTQAKSEERSD